MKILVIDGQGGGLGKQLVAALSARCPQAQLTAVGTNSLAASAMRKAGAVRTATGENAVVVNCRHADIIVGPIGIVIADALLGEITPAMAAAVCQSGAKRVLIPVNHCDNYIVGVPEQPIGDLVAALSAQCPDVRLVAVGTNSVAAQAMHKAGAQRAATGENAVVVNCRNADIIVGPIGIVIADALLGEITPAMATAVCQSSATRVLIPVNHCENYIVGVPDQPIGSLVAAAVQKVKALCAGEGC